MNSQFYHENINQLWRDIESFLDEQEVDFDCETQGQVFTITLPNEQQIVINKQEPLMELWIASRAGGFHCHFEDGQWVTNDGLKFNHLLENAFAFNGYHLTFPL